MSLFQKIQHNGFDPHYTANWTSHPEIFFTWGPISTPFSDRFLKFLWKISKRLATNRELSYVEVDGRQERSNWRTEIWNNMLWSAWLPGVIVISGKLCNKSIVFITDIIYPMKGSSFLWVCTNYFSSPIGYWGSLLRLPYSFLEWQSTLSWVLLNKCWCWLIRLPGFGSRYSLLCSV